MIIITLWKENEQTAKHWSKAAISFNERVIGEDKIQLIGFGDASRYLTAASPQFPVTLYPVLTHLSNSLSSSSHHLDNLLDSSRLFQQAFQLGPLLGLQIAIASNMLLPHEDVRDGALPGHLSKCILDRSTVIDLVELGDFELGAEFGQESLGGLAVRAPRFGEYSCAMCQWLRLEYGHTKTYQQHSHQ